MLYFSQRFPTSAPFKKEAICNFYYRRRTSLSAMIRVKSSCKICVDSSLCRNDSVGQAEFPKKKKNGEKKIQPSVSWKENLSYQPVVYLCVLVSLLSQASTTNPHLKPFFHLRVFPFLWMIFSPPAHFSAPALGKTAGKKLSRCQTANSGNPAFSPPSKSNPYFCKNPGRIIS